MYHSVTTQSSKSRGLTIDVQKLEEQLLFLKSEGYTTLHFKDLQQFSSAKDFPGKAVIITFDDVYVNQLELAYPLFVKHHLKACFYIPFKYVGGVNTWDEGVEPIMSVAQLQSLDSEVIELGLHSFAHQRYDQLSLEAIQKDFDLCKDFIVENKLDINNTLAYPYGKYPKAGEEQHAFFKCLKENNIAYGLRIGNRVNRFPFKNHYEIQRLDIKGEDSLKTFKRKLKKGKRLF
ncbi:polysaccharide deacetylase family protein [Olleya sp. YS]|uniref:polysaccharide deacetylase family protein n=1 Tax=Olleya sp. YS TaxID=3028318 RepID=UPI0024343127|nr:polysaccharide deacetylase family protein [Olleya sp. YS]WGD33969.1 polysaccharide deacetylase family protein [Olleya sp. YS]